MTSTQQPTPGQYLQAYANSHTRTDIDPLTLVGEIKDMEAAMRMATRDAIQRALDAGHTWTQIAEAMGISRQAVRERYDRGANFGRG